MVEKEKEPREVTHTIVDTTTKEYFNRGGEAQDETVIKLHKMSPMTRGEKYRFATPSGVNFGFDGNIGPQVMNLSISGDSLRITGQFSGRDESNDHAHTLAYDREVLLDYM